MKELFPGWRSPLDARRLAEVLATPHVLVFNAVLDKQIVASLTLYVVPLLSRRLAVIEEVVTAAKYRRLGFATALLKRAIFEAKKWKADVVELSVQARSQEAIRLYARFGFKKRNPQWAMRLNLRD